MRNTKEEHLTGGSLVIHPAVEDKNKGISIPLCLDKHEKSSVELSISPFQKRVLAVGDVVHASVDLQFVVGRVESIDRDLKLHGIRLYLSAKKTHQLSFLLNSILSLESWVVPKLTRLS